MKISGIYVPNIVPFTEDGRINEDELRRLTEWLIGHGVSGLYPNGSTGEFIRLTFEERIRVVEIIADQNRGRVPILAGAAEANPALVLKACQRYCDLGCVAVSLTGPYFYKVSQETIEHYFRELARQSPIDLLLYNIPQFSNEITLPVVARLAADCPRIVGIKDSSRDMPRFMNTLHLVKPIRPEFSVLVGCEEILLPCLIMGADGGTIASAGVVPEAIMAIFQAFRAGHWDEAQRLQFKILDLINTMLGAGNFPAGFRLVASLRGFQPGPDRQPHSPGELAALDTTREQLACLLLQCGCHEAAHACQDLRFHSKPASRLSSSQIDEIVRETLRNFCSP